ncbi:MAG: fumarylacetoacetate hydrolase family protein [Acidimicrobiales bacterium]
MARDKRGSRVVVATGELAVDLAAAARHGLLPSGIDPHWLRAPSLNPLLSAGPRHWQALRSAAAELAGAASSLPFGVVLSRDGLDMALPVEVGDFVDGYGGIHHASNMGRILRPDGEPLLGNWRAMPVAYHGRSSTVVASGTVVRRPRGQVLLDGIPALAPTARLDIELEVGFVIGVGNGRGAPVAADDAGGHIFGLVLLNDWSARDVQAFEYQPLGPFLGKSFATSISSWVVPLDELRPFMVQGLAASQDPPPAPYLRTAHPWIVDLHLEVLLQSASMRERGIAPAVVSRVEFAEAMYWSMAQQLAHSTVNGAVIRPGDLFGSGTASGPDPATQGGSFMELTWGGTKPLELPGGERRTFLDDGDTVTLRGWCGDDPDTGVALGDVTGTVAPFAELG